MVLIYVRRDGGSSLDHWGLSHGSVPELTCQKADC